MEDSPSPIAWLILRNLLTSIFIHVDKPLIHLLQNFRLLRFLRALLVSAFLFFLDLLPSLFPSPRPSAKSQDHLLSSTKDDVSSARVGGFRYGGRSGVERALIQLLLIMNDIPVSSRKYEVVRSLAEKLIDENLSAGTSNEALKEVNCAVLTAAFGMTLSQLESAVAEQGRRSGSGSSGGGEATTVQGRENDYYLYSTASRLFSGVKNCGKAVWRYAKPWDEQSRSRSSAEKLAAEILWLAQKMAASGCAGEAVCKWAVSSNLAWLALTTEPRLQGSLVKVSAFLIKQAKELGSNTVKEKKEQQEPDNAKQQKTRQIKMKMLISWLPLLCAANNGTDAPIVNTSERAELEKIMEEIIWTLDEEHQEQERVLSVWLHHFSYCSASDWPNLRSCYNRWFGASRTRLLQEPPPVPA